MKPGKIVSFGVKSKTLQLHYTCNAVLGASQKQTVI